MFALLLSFTAVNAQLHTLDGKASNLMQKQSRQGLLKMPGKTTGSASKIAMDPDEKIMGFYNSDEIGTNPVGLRTDYPIQLKAGAEFSPDVIGHFAGGQITKVRFAVAMSVGASKVYIYPATEEGDIGNAVAEVDVPTTKAGWNDVTLSTPVTIEKGMYYLICYDYTQQSNQYPLSNDSGVNPEGGIPGGMLIYGNLNPEIGLGWYDMGTDYGNLCIQAVVKGAVFPEYDLKVSAMNTELFAQAGQNVNYSYSVKNLGTQIPSSYTLDILFDNKVIATVDNPVAVTNYSQAVKGNITIPADVENGKHKLGVKIAKINGEAPTGYTDDDLSNADVNVYIESMPRKMNLVEQFTSTKCPPCGAYAGPVIEALLNLRKDVVLVAHHNKIPNSGDPMVCDEALAVTSALTNFNPSGVFNRYYETDVELNQEGDLALNISFYPQYAEMAAEMFSDIIDNSNKLPTFASIALQTTYDEGTRKLTVDVEGSCVNDFKEFIGEDAVLSVYLTEDGIVAAQAGASATTEHNNVMRKSLTDVWGNAINWNGNTYKNTYEITLDSKWKAENMHVVAFISKPYTKGVKLDNIWVNNANTCKVGGGASGIGNAIIDNGNGTEVERYTIGGTRINQPVKGINIVKMSDGRVVKVIVKE